MGLESVELIAECERRFAISIDDREAARCASVGDLQDLVVSKLALNSASRCLGAHVFYRLRRALLQPDSLPKASIRPSTPVAAVLGPKIDPGRWTDLEAAVGLRLPALALPASLGRLWLAAFVSLPVAGVLGVSGLLGGVAAWSAAAAALLTIALLLALHRDLANQPPHDVQTVGDLARRTLSLNVTELAREEGASERDIRSAVAEMIGEELGVDRSLIVPEAEFVRDLGVD